MTRYIKPTTNRHDTYHKSDDGETPFCYSHGEFIEISEDETEGLDLCEHCQTGEMHHGPYPKQRLTEMILGAVDNEWLSITELDAELTPAKGTLRKRCNELVQSGDLNRRGGLADNDGSKGYEYSQQEMQQATYQENTNLFESMLEGD